MDNAVQTLFFQEFAYLRDVLAEGGFIGLGQGRRVDSVTVFFEEGDHLVPQAAISLTTVDQDLICQHHCPPLISASAKILPRIEP